MIGTFITADEAGDPNLPKWLQLVSFSEGTASGPDNGYGVIVSGVTGPNSFTDYSDHPFAGGRDPIVVALVPRLLSTASGRYQILLRYWLFYKRLLALDNFSPLSQDKVAIRQAKEKGALPLIAAGNIEAAIDACSGLYASFPGNTYGQGGHTMAALSEYWGTLDDKFLGRSGASVLS